MNLPTIYIGMALTHATAAFRERFGTLLPQRITERGFQVTRYMGLTDGTARDVYVHDMEAVRSADYMLAICDSPSLGLGMEIAERINVQKPLLVAWKQGEVLSRMLSGAIGAHHIPYCVYRDLDDIVRELVRQRLKER
jgi:hypothetical protein